MLTTDDKLLKLINDKRKTLKKIVMQLTSDCARYVNREIVSERWK